jgi:hypothetical protein
VTLAVHKTASQEVPQSQRRKILLQFTVCDFEFRMRDLLDLRIPNSLDSETWINEMNLEQRGLQIESEIAPDAGVWMASHGDQTSNSGVTLEVDIKFVFKDFSLAVEEFGKVGTKLKFPKGSTLTHVTYNPDAGTFGFNTLVEW